MKTRTEMKRMLQRLRRRVASLEAALAEPPVSVVRSPGLTTSLAKSPPAEAPRWRSTHRSAGKSFKAPFSELGAWRGLLATLPGWSWAVDRHGVVRSCRGPRAEAPESLVGGSLETLLGDFPGAVELVWGILAGDHPHGELRYDAASGQALWAAPLWDDTWTIVGAVGLCIDAAKLLPQGTGTWVEPSSAEEVLGTQEQERRLIAYEIHDGFVQEATGAMMHLEALLETGRVPEGRAHQEVEHALRLVRKAVAEARRVIGGLLPPVLEERGVVAALEYWIEEQSPGGPSVRWHVDVPWQRWEPLLEGMLYRILQEALTNVRRHSGSERAEVRLTQRGDLLRVEVRDWGIGFDPNGIEGKRFGLRGIRERARLLGGRATIDSVPGKGTRVFVDLPLARTLREVATT